MGDALGSLGCQVSVVEASPERAVLLTPTCPLCPLIRAHPKATELDRGMWNGLATRALTGVEIGDIVCETRGCLEAGAPCRVAIAFRK